MKNICDIAVLVAGCARCHQKAAAPALSRTAQALAIKSLALGSPSPLFFF